MSSQDRIAERKRRFGETSLSNTDLSNEQDKKKQRLERFGGNKAAKQGSIHIANEAHVDEETIKKRREKFNVTDENNDIALGLNHYSDLKKKPQRRAIRKRLGIRTQKNNMRGRDNNSNNNQRNQRVQRRKISSEGFRSRRNNFGRFNNNNRRDRDVNPSNNRQNNNNVLRRNSFNRNRNDNQGRRFNDNNNNGNNGRRNYSNNNNNFNRYRRSNRRF